jgi:hypothetical protein
MGRHSRTSSREKRIKKDKKREKRSPKAEEIPDNLKIVFRPRTNWSKEQKNLDEIDPEELKQVKSDYIREDSTLMQTYNIQSIQKKLFKELIPSSQKVDHQSLLETPESTNYPQPLPIIKRESGTYYYRGYVPGVTNVLMDETKIKRKIKIPTNTGFNFAGLIIGPKGANQKRLEEETGCKILVRGKGNLIRLAEGRTAIRTRRLRRLARAYCRKHTRASREGHQRNREDLVCG